MWKISWFYEKEHNFLVVPLYYESPNCLTDNKVPWDRDSILSVL